MDDENITGGQGWYNLTLTVDPDDTDRLVSGGVRIYDSTDGGTTWEITGGGNILGSETAVHLDHHALVYEPGSTNNVWAGTDGGVWRSTDDGVTWSSRREGIVTYQFYDICVAQSDPQFMMGGTQDNGVPGRDAPDTWFRSNLLADGMVCNIKPGNANGIQAEWQFGNHVKSTDGGLSWVPKMNGITGSGSWVAPVDMDQNQPNVLYTATSDGIFKTSNGAGLWEPVGNQTAIWISINLSDGNVVWSVNSGGAWVSTDAGGTWTQCASYGFAVGSEQKIQAHPTDLGTAWVVFGSYSSVAHVAMTTDYGASWTDVTGDFPAQPVNTMIADDEYPDDWYIGTDVGIWKSTNGGVNWVPFDTGLPNVVVSDLEIQRNTRKLVAGTYGRGVWETDLPPAQTTDVAQISAPQGPLNLMLDRPYPNPASDRVWLRYAAKHEGAVFLEIYDVQGRLVSRVAEHSRGDGVIRPVEWFTDDVTSGVYFAVLRAGSLQRSQKVVVAR